MREITGEKVFTRGEVYHRNGQVQILAIKPDRVLAQVTGTEDYRTELAGKGEDIDGNCSCPAFEDRGFCKHMVATALAANEFRADEIDGGALARIRDHLKEKGIDALVEIIVGLVEQDPTLFRKLDAAAVLLHADDETVGQRLRKAIDGATRVRDFIDYRKASDWVANVDSVLDSIAGLASGTRAGLARELAERAIERIEHAIEGIDDSDGGCGALLGRARDIHLAAVRETRPEPIQLARDLFAREMHDEYGTFDGAVALYAEVLGESGLAEYRRLAAEAWEKLSQCSSRGRQQEFDDNSDQLMRILDFFAERAGDVDARIALRAKDLSSQWDYLQLAEFCRSHEREEEAVRRAEEGLWMFEDERPDERLVLFAADALSKAGRSANAEAHLWRAFEKTPSLHLYARLRKFGGEEMRDRAVSFLEAKQASGARFHWFQPSDLLVRIWMQEKMFDAAWAVATKHGLSPVLKDELARASEATHPREALEVYAERVVLFVNAGGNAAYAEAAKLIARMATLRSRKEQADYVLGLKARFDRKRNFMKLLG
ncbi:SWIM zinc finger family protein [Bradyrhizobium sp. AUGA SZCCT0222]|nr:SWIM zinc finger family protein [Bradyrhizobium sp. AUGA SZCCT0222]